MSAFWQLVVDVLLLRPLPLADLTWGRTAALALLAASSRLVGHLVVLVINRVHGVWFAASALASGLGLLAAQALLAVLLWLAVRTIGPSRAPLSLAIQGVVFTSAPVLFGFLEMAPVLGPPIGRVLDAWCFVALWTVTDDLLPVGPLVALALVAVAWIAQRLVLVVVRPPLRSLRRELFRRSLGREPYDSAAALLLRRTEVDQP